MPNLIYTDIVSLHDLLLNKLRQELSGSDAVFLLGRIPRRSFHVGVISPESLAWPNPTTSAPKQDVEGDDDVSPATATPITPEAEDSDDAPDTAGTTIINPTRQKYLPSALGLDTLIKTTDNRIVLHLTASFRLFYRVFPSYDEQFKHEFPDNTFQAASGRVQSRLLYKYKPLHIEPISIDIPIDLSQPLPIRINKNPVLDSALRVVLGNAASKVQSDPEAWGWSSQRATIPKNSLQTQQEYSKAINAKRRSSSTPAWDATVTTEVYSVSQNVFHVGVSLSNATLLHAAGCLASRNVAEKCSGGASCPHNSGHALEFFNTALELTITGAKFEPFQFSGTPSDYRYDRRFFGFGQNCVAVYNPSTCALRTECLPQYEQPLLETISTPTALFAELATTPLPVLEAIGKAMDSYLQEWQVVVDTQTLDGRTLTADEVATCTRDKAAFANEVERYRIGVTWLTKDQRILKAFCLMNKTFEISGQYKNIKSWRLFQIVYIVSLLPSLAVRENPDVELLKELEICDILWFPTGGGKTEAYLGIIACAMFYDRLRGKNAGVTAWIRFPLRMLSIQQLQRMVNIVSIAEEIRKTALPTPSGDPFGVGFLVGQANTPNKLWEYKKRDDKRPHIIEIIANDPALRKKYQLIAVCPFCHQQNVEMVADIKAIRLRHICRNPNCEKEIPIYITDTEVFRYLPSVVVGTVDKLASIGLSGKFGHLFGHVDSYCSEHGYASKGECTEKYGCKMPTGSLAPVVMYDPAPSLELQDELHLLKEDFGAFNSHYETLVQRYQTLIGKKLPNKVLAATATIQDYELQAKHLYLLKARRFPVPGIRNHETFYARVVPAKYRRRYVALMPPIVNLSEISKETLRIYHATIREWLQSPEKLLSTGVLSSTLDVPTLTQLLRFFDLTLTYVNRKAEGSNITHELDYVKQYLATKNKEQFRTEFLHGNVPFLDVSAVINSIDVRDTPRRSDEIDNIVATSIISHGVDIERFNFMLLVGGMGKTADYIQTSSRCGRTVLGTVFVLLNKNSLWDRSLFHFFFPFHRFLDRLVEGIAINRFSEFATTRTVPGLVSALLLNYFDREQPVPKNMKFYRRDNVVQAFGPSGFIKMDEFSELIVSALGLDRSDLVDPSIAQGASEDVKRQVRQLITRLSSRTESFLTEALKPGPRTSFRQIDDPLPFIVDPKNAADTQIIFHLRSI